MRQTLCCCLSSIYTEIAIPFLNFPIAFIRPLELTIPDWRYQSPDNVHHDHDLQ
ncbi:unnamed protein product, partial [Clonostachys rosea]